MRHLYNSYITIQESTQVKDEYGSWTTTWEDVSDLKNLPCRWNWLVGIARGETIIGGKISWISDAKVYLSYYTNLTVEMRVVYNDKNYDIVNLVNVDEVGNYMVLFLKKGED